MPLATNDSHLNLFADDTSTFLADNNAERLKMSIMSTLNNINEWLRMNKLVLNTNKTCFTIFKHKNQNIPDFLNSVCLGSSLIRRVKSAKLLGVTIDEDLSFKDHVDSLHLSL